MSSSVQNMFLQVPLRETLTLYNEKVVPRLTQKNKAVGLGVAVVMTLIYIIRDRVFKPPKNVRHIPYLGYFNVIKTFIKGESLFDRGYRVHVPKIDSSHGLHIEPGTKGWEIHVSNPEDAKRILLKHDKFPKMYFVGGNMGTILAKFLGGPNILMLSGHEWRSQRKVANPAFHRSMPVKLFGELTQQLFQQMEKAPGDTVEVTELMFRWTLEAIGKAGFGFDFNAIHDENSKWVKVYTTINDGLADRKFFLFPFLDQQWLWMFPKRQQVHKKMDEFLTMLDDVIQAKRKALNEGRVTNDALDENERDLLTLMIESENRGEGKLTDEELKANLCLFFFAGHDTTSSALSFAIYHLAKHPEIQQRAREEAFAVLGDEPVDILPTVEDTRQMTYINMIMKETMRISDPVPKLSARHITEDTVLPSGVFIPKGALVCINIFGIHHSEKVWNNASVFDPERFADDGEAIKEGMSWIPFGNGARQCIGMNFSLNEQRVMLSMLLRKFTWSIPEGSIHADDVRATGFPIVCPQHMELTFKKRY